MTVTLHVKWALKGNNRLVSVLSFGRIRLHPPGRIWATLGHIRVAPLGLNAMAFRPPENNAHSY